MSKGYADMSERELALWMLERMQGSEAFLRDIRAARVKGKPDVLDEPEYVDRHKWRLKRLFQGSGGEDVDVPASTAAVIDHLVERDALSSTEELIEKALAAYIEKHQDGAVGLPQQWQSTIDMARAEIEGKTRGNFHEGFAAELATAARAEMDRQAAKERARSKDRDRGD